MATISRQTSLSQGRALSKLFLPTHNETPHRVPRTLDPPSTLPQHQTPKKIQKGDNHDSSKRTSSSSKTKGAHELAGIINRSPWSKELEPHLSSYLPFSRTTVRQTLYLIKSPLKALQFFNWVRAKGFLDSKCLFSILEILTQACCLNAAKNLLFSMAKQPKEGSLVRLEAQCFNSLIGGYGRAGLFKESIKVFAYMKSLGVSPSTVTFNSLFSVLLQRGRTVMAQQLYDEMLKTFGANPNVFTFNILIKGFCRSAMVDEGLRFFNQMSRFDCDPDIITYNTLVDGLCRDGRVEVANNLVKGMGRKGPDDPGPNVVTYTALIRGYCAKRNINEALHVLEEMVQRKIKPNRITYNTLIKGLCEAERLDMIKELLAQMREDKETAPDTCTMNTLMSYFCSLGKVDEAVSVFQQFSGFQLIPDSASYSVLIRGLCQRGEFNKAEELFDELCQKEILARVKGSEPLVAAYNPMFVYLCANGKTKKAAKAFKQLMKSGIQDPSSYQILIMGHCREGSFMAAYDLLVLMLRRDYELDFRSYESLIEGLLSDNGDPILAHRVLEMMLKGSHHPLTCTFHSVLSELVKHGHASESASLIMLMLEKEIRQNVRLSTDTVILQFRSGMKDKAFKILSLLHEHGYTVRIEEIVSFLCGKKKLLDACEMLMFSMQRDGKVDITVCDEVISGLCKTRKNSEAFGLYFELVERGVNERLSCLNSLKNSLLFAGKSKEAEFVSKRMLRNNAEVLRRRE